MALLCRRTVWWFLVAASTTSLAPVRLPLRMSMAAPMPASLPLRGGEGDTRAHGKALAPKKAPKMAVLETGAAFDAALAAHERVAVLVSAPWCRACKVVKPKFKRLADDFDGTVACYEISHPNLAGIADGSAILDAATIAKDIAVTPTVALYESGSRVDLYSAGPTRFKATREKLEAWVGGGDPSDVACPEPARAAPAGRTVDHGSSLPPRRDLLQDMRRPSRESAPMR